MLGLVEICEVESSRSSEVDRVGEYGAAATAHVRLEIPARSDAPHLPAHNRGVKGHSGISSVSGLCANRNTTITQLHLKAST